MKVSLIISSRTLLVTEELMWTGSRWVDPEAVDWRWHGGTPSGAPLARWRQRRWLMAALAAAAAPRHAGLAVWAARDRSSPGGWSLSLAPADTLWDPSEGAPAELPVREAFRLLWNMGAVHDVQEG